MPFDGRSLAGRKALMNENLQAVKDQLQKFAVGARPSRYGRRYGARYEYGVGQASSAARAAQLNQDCNWPDSSITAGHGRATDPRPVGPCKPIPPRCDCHVIGINTLGTTGIASNAFGNLVIDSGDADFFIPYYIAIIAFELNTTTNNLIINPGTPLMVLLVQSTSGQEPNMRRASTTDQTFGVWTLVYGFEKEIECVDWRKFGSVTNQNLTMRFFNPNTVAVHVFVNIWGTAGVAR
jgi:hypothetical protein